jgi:hypothetical protein
MENFMLPMEKFDFEAPAEVFTGGGHSDSRRPMRYLRSGTGAEAVRHVIERQQPDLLAATVGGSTKCASAEWQSGNFTIAPPIRFIAGQPTEARPSHIARSGSHIQVETSSRSLCRGTATQRTQASRLKQ